MSRILKGCHRYKTKVQVGQPVLISISRLNYHSFSKNGGQNNRRRYLLQVNTGSRGGSEIVIVRGYGMIIARVLRGALKLRYLLLGGAIGGGMTLNKKYEDWKEGLPDFKWLEDILPDNEQWGKFSEGLITFRNSIKDSIHIDPRLKQLGEDRMAEWRAWFDSRLDNAIEAAEHQENQQIEITQDELKTKHTVSAISLSPDEGRRKYEALQNQIETLQTEIMNVQIKYQRELEKLEKENRELRQQYLILKTNRKTLTKKIKKSLIDVLGGIG